MARMLMPGRCCSHITQMQVFPHDKSSLQWLLPT